MKKSFTEIFAIEILQEFCIIFVCFYHFMQAEKIDR